MSILSVSKCINNSFLLVILNMSKSVKSTKVKGGDKRLEQIGDDIWKNRTTKINNELFTMTYGSIVGQICREENYNYNKVNEILFNMGYNIGNRLIEEFLSISLIERCNNFKETAEVISKIGFRMFLNISPIISNWSIDEQTFQLTFEENPLAEFVELPDEYDEEEENNSSSNIKGNARGELWYSNILCGVLKGCLEMVQLECEVWFVSDVLRGDDNTSIKVRLINILRDEIPVGDD